MLTIKIKIGSFKRFFENQNVMFKRTKHIYLAKLGDILKTVETN